MILIDTHVFLWALKGEERLGPAQRALLTAEAGRTFVSIASLWEVEIKRGLGKLTAPDDLADGVRLFGWRLLPITASHTSAAGQLPKLHRDPFDRMLVAQSLTEGLPLVTRDEALLAYGIDARW